MDDPEFAARFTREIRSLVKLSHPHIVKVTDVGTRKVPFAVMQFLPGGSLEDQRPLTGRSAPTVSIPGVSPAGSLPSPRRSTTSMPEGYVHRDVKPGNILFDRSVTRS